MTDEPKATDAKAKPKATKTATAPVNRDCIVCQHRLNDDHLCPRCGYQAPGGPVKV